MASVPRAQQVLANQVRIRPERYEDYHRDLIEIINDALRAIADSTDRAKRRKDLGGAIQAKASQIPTNGADK